MKSDGRLGAEIEAAASSWVAKRDAGMTFAEEAEFAHWMADGRNAEALKRHEATWSLFDRPVKAGQGAALAAQFRERFRKRRRRRVVALASTITCLLLGGLAWRWAAPMGEHAVPVRSIVVAPERRTLPDGSVVELNVGAEISVDFSGPNRRVSLRRGEAHYEVAKDPNRPFIVEVGGVEVRAVGTAFSVELGKQAVAILVTEGTVAVDASLPPTKIVGAPVEAAPHGLGLVDAGNRLVVDLSPEAVSRSRLDPISPKETAERLAWRAPRLEFFGAPLAEAVAQMNRYNKIQFVVEDPAVGSLEVSGYFRADNYALFLELIEQGLSLKSERKGDTIYLHKAR